VAHPEKLKSFLQSCFALLQQFAHVTLTEKFFDFASILLGLNESMYLVQCSE
jgi:hypothetical protein